MGKLLGVRTRAAASQVLLERHAVNISSRLLLLPPKTAPGGTQEVTVAGKQGGGAVKLGSPSPAKLRCREMEVRLTRHSSLYQGRLCFPIAFPYIYTYKRCIRSPKRPPEQTDTHSRQRSMKFHSANCHKNQGKSNNEGERGTRLISMET